MVQAIRAARLLTSSSAKLLENGVVVVDGETITSVGTWSEIKGSLADIPIQDLGDVTLMPGLFDCHVGTPELPNQTGFTHGKARLMRDITGPLAAGPHRAELDADHPD